MSHLKLTLLGPPRLEQEGGSVEVDTRKAIAMLAYLAIQGEHLGRDTLATLFWPEYDQSQARANLRRTLSALVKAIGKERLEIDRETLGLVRDADFWVDVIQFRHLLAEAGEFHQAPEVLTPACLDLLRQALGLYHADFMAGFTLRDSPEFDEWQFFQRETLRREVISALEKLVQGYTAQGELDLAAIYAHRWVVLDPLDEEAHRQLMRLYAWTGQRSAALRQYQELVRILDQELGVAPQEEIQTLYRTIEEGQLPSPAPKPTKEVEPQAAQKIAAVPPSPLPAATHRDNLPAQTTPFIGREAELAELTELLASSDCRLLTLVGPGGIGKTRLAIEVATLQREKFGDGVWFVSLASISGVEFIPTAVGDALPMTLFGPDKPKDQLLHYLRDKNMLLIIDNLEHLLEGVDLLSEILSEAPGVKFMVTSRERLNMHGEWVFEIEGLAFPPPDQLDKLESYSAVLLFLQAARRSHANFKLVGADRPAVVHICRLMEGMPLGLELAAAWVHLLSCAEIAAEIERNMDFLTVTSRNVPERHRSLRAAFDHSWNLLPAEERRALRRLSVFQGSFRREAAEQVARATLPLLSALVDKSLLRRTEVGRYDMHELIRQYAASHFQEVPQEQGDIYDRYCSYYAHLLAERDASLRSDAQTETLAELKAELDNLRLAWRWAVAQHRIGEITRFIRPLSWFYELCGWYREAEMLLKEAEEMLRRSVPPEKEYPETDYRLALGEVLAHQGYFAMRGSEHKRAHQLLEEAVNLLSFTEDKLALADALMWFGFSMGRYQGHYTRSEELLRQSLALSREINHPWNEAMALSRLGSVAQALNRLEEAYRLFQESLKILRNLGDPSGTAYSLSSLGVVATMLGHYTEARSLLQESLTLALEIGNQWEIAFSLTSLGLEALAQEDYSRAQQLFRESINAFREIGDQWNIARTLNLLGRATHALGACAEANAIFREALKIATRIQATTITLQIVIAWALLLSDFPESRPLARELLLALLQHPAAEQNLQNRVRQHLADLEGNFPSSLPETARPFDLLIDELLRSTVK